MLNRKNAAQVHKHAGKEQFHEQLQKSVNKTGQHLPSHQVRVDVGAGANLADQCEEEGLVGNCEEEEADGESMKEQWVFENLGHRTGD